MNLPKLILRMIPDGRCLRCGSSAYTEVKCHLCAGCLDIALKLYERHKRKEAVQSNGGGGKHSEVKGQGDQGKEEGAKEAAAGAG